MMALYEFLEPGDSGENICFRYSGSENIQTDIRVIVKKSSPKNLSVDCRSTVGRQLTDRFTDSLPTVNQQVTDKLRKRENCGKHEQLT